MINMSQIKIGLTAIAAITAAWKATRPAGKDEITNTISEWKADSLIDYSRPARIEPIVLIDTDCLYHDCLQDVQQSLLSIFAGYYLQAVALSNPVGRVNVLRQLDKLNPSRDVEANVLSAATTALLSVESYKDRLPMAPGGLVLESEGDEVTKEEAEDAKKLFANNAVKDIKEVVNLSVGKVFNVEIADGKEKISIPISIRLLASAIPSSNMVHILSMNSKDNSAKERYHGWKQGNLEFIKDLCLCQDLIDAHRHNLMTDKDGVYTNIVKRARMNQASTILSGAPSVATASNLVVISNTTAEALELEVMGKLSDFKTREKIFETGYMMILVVVDKSWDMVTFYFRGIHLPTQLSTKAIKGANKGTGPDVAEIMKAFMMGSPASI